MDIDYYKQRRPPNNFSEFIDLFWQYDNSESSEDILITIIPDGYFYLIYYIRENEPMLLILTTISTKARNTMIPKGEKLYAVRFKIPSINAIFDTLYHKDDHYTQLNRKMPEDNIFYSLSCACWTDFSVFVKEFSDIINLKGELKLYAWFSLLILLIITSYKFSAKLYVITTTNVLLFIFIFLNRMQRWLEFPIHHAASFCQWMFTIVILFGICIKKPFSMSIAKPMVPKEVWKSPKFIKNNTFISGIWALVFTLNGILYYVFDYSWLLRFVCLFLTLFCLRFSDYFPRYIQKKS